jgi:hypothetical protein
MRFGHHPVPAEAAVEIAPDVERRDQELFVRHARKDGHLVAVLRAVDRGDSCVVEAEVFPRGSMHQVRQGPYVFANPHEAGEFVTEAVAALMYLGCDVQAE